MQQAAVPVHGLVKRFGDVEAVRGIDLEIAAGEVFGFLGPNGAGKSTTISMLCTLLTPTTGTAQSPATTSCAIAIWSVATSASSSRTPRWTRT